MRGIYGFVFGLFLVSMASAADNSMFNYQARVLVQGIPYTGTGQVKVAILANSAGTTATLWSNDGTSLAGSQPAGSVPVSVTGGVFDTMIGDTALGMQSIPAIIFNRNDELKIRVWFNDGSHGFQQLAPDRRLTNPRRLGIDDIHSSTTLYVNAATGNDVNNGLSLATAKKTIQAAVDMVPPRLFANLTIDVADGIYRESVAITGITAQEPYRLKLAGDTACTPSDSVSPAVRLTGTDNDSNHTKVRSNGFFLTGCNNVEINGFLIDYYLAKGLFFQNSLCFVNNCKASYTDTGFFVVTSNLTLSKTWASFNSWAGFSLYNASQGYAGNCGANDNTTYGVLLRNNSAIDLGAGNVVARNSQGIGVETSYLWNQGTQTITGNSIVGIALRFHSACRNSGSWSYSGNGTNMSVNSDSWSL